MTNNSILTRIWKNGPFNFLSANGLFLIVLFALAIRMIFFVSIQPWNQEVVEESIIVSDAYEYNQLALSLMDNQSFEDYKSYRRTPGYPVFIALMYGISSSAVWFVLLGQIFLSTFSVLIVYKISTAIFTRRVALLSAFFFAIDIHQALYTVALVSDTLFVFLFLLSIYYLIRSVNDNSFKYVCFSALVLGVATLVRPVSILIPLIIIFFILAFSKFSIKMKVAYSMLFGVIFIAAISPWMLHNYSKYGVAKLTSQSGSNLLFCNVASTEAYKTGKSMKQVNKEFMSLAIKLGADSTEKKSFQSSRIYFEIAQNYIKDNLILYSKRHLMGIINMYTSIGTQRIASIFDLKSKPLNLRQEQGPSIFLRAHDFFHSKTIAEITIAICIAIYLLINYVFAFYGIIVLLRKNNGYVYLFLFIILYFSLITGVIGNARLKIPFMPFINILGAVGFMSFFDIISLTIGKARS